MHITPKLILQFIFNHDYVVEIVKDVKNNIVWKVNAYKSISLSQVEWDEAEKLRSDPFFLSRNKNIFFLLNSVDWFVFNSPPIYHSFHSFFFAFSDSTTACSGVYKNQIMTAFPCERQTFSFYRNYFRFIIFWLSQLVVSVAVMLFRSSFFIYHRLLTTK